MEAGLEDGNGVAETGGGLGKQIRELAEEMVRNLAGGAVDEQQARLVPPVRRDLGNCFLGEVIIELSRFHVGTKR